MDAGAVEEIPLRGARTVTVGEDTIAVFRTGDGAVFALIDRCPHKGGPLSQGIVHGHSVACPLHNWSIALATGQAQAPDRGCTPTIPVRIEAGRVLIAMSSPVLA
jgi:nitrite reductase (NADH) small subunit